MELYEVGGCVRDEILGIQSSDIDYTVVLDPSEIETTYTKKGQPIVPDPFDVMDKELQRRGFKVFLRTKEYLTIRAQFPKPHSLVAISHHRAGQTADFVLARKESDYTDGRRPDKVEIGSLEDDLARRDFTMNAIAKFTDGDRGGYIDPFDGVQDIHDQIIRAVGDPVARLTEHALRAVRALRFYVTKGFALDADLCDAMEHPLVLDAIVNKISDERIQVELSKMFRFDTLDSLQVLRDYPNLTDAMFAGSVSLDATMKTKGRGNNTRKVLDSGTVDW